MSDRRSTSFLTVTNADEMSDAMRKAQMATGDRVLRAYDRAVARIMSDDDMTACDVSAGFVIPNGQKRGHETGLQVFVSVCRYSDDLRKADPETGGLLRNAKA